MIEQVVQLTIKMDCCVLSTSLYFQIAESVVFFGKINRLKSIISKFFLFDYNIKKQKQKTLMLTWWSTWLLRIIFSLLKLNMLYTFTIFLQDYTLWVFYFMKLIFRHLIVSLFTLMKQLKLFFLMFVWAPGIPTNTCFRQYLTCWSQTISLLVRTIFPF